MVHCFERAGLRLALDTGSGAVHVLSAPAYALLRGSGPQHFGAGAAAPRLRAFPERESEQAFQELAALAKQGLLFADDGYHEFAARLGPAPVKALCLHVAHDCNLRCRYCFASTGDFGGGRMLMPFAVAQKAIDLLIAHSEQRHHLEVDFFGGEPLMNFEVIRQTVDYARSREKESGKRFRFTVTTNGLGLSDERIDYINREMSNVVLSIDGRKEVNDAMRPLPGGQGSYDAIVPRFQKLVAARGGHGYYVRGTYTRHNTDFDKDVLALYGLGFRQISVEPAVGPAEEDYTIREEDLPAIEAAYQRLMLEMIARKRNGKGDFNFFHFMLDLENGPCAIKRLKGCGSGNEYLAVAPGGDLYPCHQFVGQGGFIMGTVDKGINRPEMRERFAAAHVLNKAECQSCWAKLFCSGGCNANNHNYCGSVLTPHPMSCMLEKIRLECAIAIQAAVAMGEAGEKG